MNARTHQVPDLRRDGRSGRTANYLKPAGGARSGRGIEAHARRHGVARVADLVGTIEVPAR